MSAPAPRFPGWEGVRFGRATDEDMGELGGQWGTLPLRDPVPVGGRPSFAHRPIATADDLLLVVALLRCKRNGGVIGAVLHLDRATRDLPPVLLAELWRGDYDQGVSTATRTARGRSLGASGERFAGIAALPIGDGDWPADHVFRLDCPEVGSVHPVTPAELRDAGRRGFAKVAMAHRAGQSVRPLSVDLERTVSRWSPGR